MNDLPSVIFEQHLRGASRNEQGGWVNTSSMRALSRLPMDKVMFLLSPFSNEQFSKKAQK
jgi:hypothetical protein